MHPNTERLLVRRLEAVERALLDSHKRILENEARFAALEEYLGLHLSIRAEERIVSTGRLGVGRDDWNLTPPPPPVP